MLSSIFSTKEEKTKADTIKLNNSITLNNTGTKTMTSVDNEKSQTQNNQNSGDNSNNKNSQNNDSQSKENNNNSGNNNNGGNNSESNTTNDIYMIIKIYNISKNDLKIDIYEKRNAEEEIYMTAIEMRKDTEKGKAEVGIYDYETNSKIILTKRTESEKVYNVLEKAMIQEKENEVKFGSKLELERTEKTDVSTIAYKVNYTEKSLKEDNTKSLVYENEIKFGGAKIEDNPSRKIVNITDLSQADFNNTVKNVIFTQIQKVLLEKLYKLQNVGNAV